MRPPTRHHPAIALLLIALLWAILIGLPATVPTGRALPATPTPDVTPDPLITPTPPNWPPELRKPPPFQRTWLPYAVIPFAAGPASVADPIRGRLYLAGSDRIAVYSADPALLAELPIHADRLFLSPAGERLYITTPSTAAATNGGPAAIHVIDTTTLTITAKLPYACPPGVIPCRILDLAEGPDRRLYVTPDGGLTAIPTRVDVLDGRTGDPLAAVIASDIPHTVAQVEIHDTRLYVAPANYPDTFPDPYVNAIAVFDISAAAPVYLGAYEASPPYNGMRLSPDGSFMYLGSGYEFLMLDTQAFITFRLGRYGVLRDITADRTLLMNTWDAAGYPAFYESDMSVDYGLRGLDRRSPLFGDPTLGEPSPGDPTPYALALPDGGIATLHDYAVVLRRPADHAAALPIVTNDE